MEFVTESEEIQRGRIEKYELIKFQSKLFRANVALKVDNILRDQCSHSKRLCIKQRELEPLIEQQFEKSARKLYSGKFSDSKSYETFKNKTCEKFSDNLLGSISFLQFWGNLSIPSEMDRLKIKDKITKICLDQFDKNALPVLETVNPQLVKTLRQPTTGAGTVHISDVTLESRPLPKQESTVAKSTDEILTKLDEILAKTDKGTLDEISFDFEIKPEDMVKIQKAVDKHNVKLEQHLDNLKSLLSQVKRQQDREAKIKLDEEKIQRDADNIKAGFDGLGVLAFISGERETRDKLRACGKTGYDLYKILSSPFDPLISSIKTSDIIFSLIDMFSEKPEDTFREEFRDAIAELHRAIEDAVRILSLKIREMTEIIIGDIRDLHQFVGEQCANIMIEFFALSQGHKHIIAELDRIHSTLIDGQIMTMGEMYYQQRCAGKRHEEVCSLFADLPKNEIDITHNSFLIESQRGDLSGERFLDMISKYHGYIKVLSTTGSLTGSHILDDDQRTIDALKSESITRHPIYRHFDLMIRLVQKYLSLNPGEIREISNPQILLKCVDYLLVIGDRFTTGLSIVQRDVCLELLREILFKLEQNIKVLSFVLQPNIVSKTLDLYFDKLREIKLAIVDHEKVNHVAKMKSDMKNRLLSLAEKEIETLKHMRCPNFESLRAQLVYFDQMADIATDDVAANHAKPHKPFISRTMNHGGRPSLPVKFGTGITNIESLNCEIYNDDFKATIDNILKAQKSHWVKISTELQEMVRQKLEQNLAYLDRIDLIEWTSKEPVSLVYPEQIDRFNLILCFPEGLTTPEYSKLAFLTGQGTTRFTYHIKDNQLFIKGIFKIQERETTIVNFRHNHIKSIETDEDLYNMVYGGRFSRDENDTITVFYPQIGLTGCVLTFDNPRSVIGICRYPDAIIRTGICKSLLSIQTHINVDLSTMTQIGEHIRRHRHESRKHCVMLLQNHRTDIGKIGIKLDLFYCLLSSSLALYQGQLQPLLDISRTKIKTRDDIEDLLLKSDNLDFDDLYQEELVFTGQHEILITACRQSDLMRKLIGRITNIDDKKKSIDVLDRLKDSLAILESENRELRKQNAQIIALLTELQRK